MTHLSKLSDRAVIRLTGADARELLQGIITQDIHLLDDEPLIFSAMLSPQGKFLFDFFIQCDGDDILLDTEASAKETLIEKLKMYRLRAKVQINDESNNHLVAVCWDENAPGDEHIWHKDPRHTSLGWRTVTPTASEFPDNESDYHQHRIALGIPDGSKDATERTLIMENGYDQLAGISFTKGCYVGQEVTARMHYRKVLKKCLFVIESETELPSSGTPIMLEDKEVGEMRSTSGRTGLGLLRLESAQPDADLTVNGQAITATLPTYMVEKVKEIQEAS